MSCHHNNKNPNGYYPVRAYINAGTYYHTTIEALDLEHATAQARAWCRDTFLPVREVMMVPANKGCAPMFRPELAVVVNVEG